MCFDEATRSEERKVVGVLGGMGPYATVAFYRQVLDCTPARKDWEHLRMIIDSNVDIPSRTRAVLYGETNPAPLMAASINALADAGADFVVVPCNSAHFFYDEVVSLIGIPWLSIIEATSVAVKALHCSGSLILGGYATVTGRLYDRYLDDALYPSDAENEVVSAVIEEIKLSNSLADVTRSRFESIIDSSNAECIVLACTELPIVYGESEICGRPVVNSNLEYARATVNYATGQAG